MLLVLRQRLGRPDPVGEGPLVSLQILASAGWRNESPSKTPHGKWVQERLLLREREICQVIVSATLFNLIFFLFLPFFFFFFALLTLMYLCSTPVGVISKSGKL